ncbi:PKD domain-containing protein [Candidatus Peregrinibacteria bacterium]|nr:PKD domain-containing protein [Candidatus Peregrinibacteria bacterium]
MEEDKKHNTNDIGDFEMGNTEPTKQPEPAATEQPASEEQPKINKYTEDIKRPDSPEIKPQVNPAGPAPEAAPKAEEAVKPVPSPQMTPAAISAQPGSGQTGVQQKPLEAPKKVVNPEARKKALLGCLGAFGGALLLFLIFAFVFLAQSSPDEVSPVAKLLGIDQSSFINGLITFVHIIFIIIALTAFVFTMVGFVQAAMAKKEDNITKKQNLKKGFIAMTALLIILVIWGIVFAYLDGKRVATGEDSLGQIVTDPEEVTQLSAPVEVKFDASRVSIDKNKYKIISFDWDFDDGETNTGQIVSHTFEEKGIYDVTLAITIQDKSTGELASGGEHHITVSITNQALASIFSADPQSGEAPLEVNFDGSESIDPDGKIESFEWDLDNDGEFDDAKGPKTKETFDKIGKYTVSLRVKSTTGEFDVSEKEINVLESVEPEAIITVVDEPDSYTVGVNYVFKGDESTSPTGKIEKYEWDFSDNSESKTTKTVSHSFSKEGSYEVTLKVTDEEDNIGETTKIINVGSPKGTPKAKISSQPSIQGDSLKLTGNAPFSVTFNALGTTDSDDNIVDYEWNFGDGSAKGFGETVNHLFAKQGTYTVILSVTDADENVGKSTMVVEVQPQGINASVSADKIEGNIPLTVNFDASASTYDDGQITSYKWDFGDGTQPKLGAATISHKYTSIGTFNASVEVIGSDNTSTKANITITVREIPLQACFVSVFENGKAPLETSFDPGCSTGTISNYFWNFGDNGTSSSVKPTHVFNAPGEYRVVLEVSDAENTVSKAELFITVTE